MLIMQFSSRISLFNFVFCLLGFIRPVISCPTGCKCRFTQVSCQNLNLRVANLTRLSKQLPNETEILYLSDNALEDFSVHLFKNLKNLRTLHLRNNYLRRMPNNSEMFLPNLREIDLEQNKIETLKASDFIGYKDVRTLYLQFNKINLLPERTFVE